MNAYVPHDAVRMRVLLVDDNEPFRRRVRNIINKLPGFELLAEARDGAQAVRLDKELQPDIIITDVLMPQLNGIEATTRIKNQSPDVAVIALSMHGDDGFRRAMLNAGALTYLLKDNVRHELPKALRSIAAAQPAPAGATNG